MFLFFVIVVCWGFARPNPQHKKTFLQLQKMFFDECIMVLNYLFRNCYLFVWGFGGGQIPSKLKLQKIKNIIQTKNQQKHRATHSSNKAWQGRPFTNPPCASVDKSHSRPVSQPASRPASQPASQLVSRPAGQPASRPAGRLASQSTS